MWLSAIIRFSPEARVGPHHHHPSLLWIIPLISSQGHRRDNFVRAGSGYWETFGHFSGTSLVFTVVKYSSALWLDFHNLGPISDTGLNFWVQHPWHTEHNLNIKENVQHKLWKDPPPSPPQNVSKYSFVLECTDLAKLQCCGPSEYLPKKLS